MVVKARDGGRHRHIHQGRRIQQKMMSKAVQAEGKQKRSSTEGQRCKSASIRARRSGRRRARSPCSVLAVSVTTAHRPFVVASYGAPMTSISEGEMAIGELLGRWPTPKDWAIARCPHSGLPSVQTTTTRRPSARRSPRAQVWRSLSSSIERFDGSPGLLDCKRKSNPLTDEVEDGGRAAVIEEGVSALVYGYARTRDFLDGATEVEHMTLVLVRPSF